MTNLIVLQFHNISVQNISGLASQIYSGIPGFQGGHSLQVL